MHHEYSGQLLDRAFLRLLPDIFLHPVWIHFVEAEAPLLPDQIQSLADAGDELLSAGDLVEACQTLFICAFQQIRADDYGAASDNIQRILVLAEQHGLMQVACWATWGAAALCVRRGWFQQAAEHLEHLQSLLGQEQEWVLSGVIDLIQRALVSETQAEIAAGQPLSSDAVLSSAFEQMLHWGTPHGAHTINHINGTDRHADHAPRQPSESAGFSWRSLWQKVRRVFRGELRLKWVETIGSDLLPHLDEQHVPAIYSPVMSPTPAAAQLLPHPEQPATSEQMLSLERSFEPARSSTPTRDQPVALDQSAALDQPDLAARPAAPPSITAHLLGNFSFSINDATVQSWPTGKGRAVFKYMLTHHEQPIPRDVLMDAFWPQAGPEAARNSLNVALYGLRQSLKTVTDKPVVVFEEGAYCIDPEFDIWVDVDEFERHAQAGRHFEAKEQLTRAVAEYEAAIELYQGDFLAGDPYEEWPVLPRERLRVAYLDILDRLSQIHFNQGRYPNCIASCHLALMRDACREDIHSLLMRCFSRQGQRHLALRQYQACVEALRTDLDVAPAPSTTQLYERIRHRERV